MHRVPLDDITSKLLTEKLKDLHLFILSFNFAISRDCGDVVLPKTRESILSFGAFAIK